MNNKLYKQFSMTIDDFQKKVLPIEWTERSILLSEGFALCAIAKMYDIDVLIESGTYNGRSTKIWTKFFETNIDIYSIDIHINNKARNFLKNDRVILIEGDSNSIIRDITSKYQEKKVGIFIDGPKGKEAVYLLEKLIDYQNVYFIGIHDLHRNDFTKNRPLRARDLFEKINYDKFLTDDMDFVNSYSFLDNYDLNQIDQENQLSWKPNCYIDTKTNTIARDLGSYGPTIGFALK